MLPTLRMNPRTNQELLLEVRKDLGLMEDDSLSIGMCGFGHYSTNSSPISLPFYPPGFEPVSYEPESLFSDPKQNRPKEFRPNAIANMDKVSSSSRDEELVLAELVL